MKKEKLEGVLSKRRKLIISATIFIVGILMLFLIVRISKERFLFINDFKFFRINMSFDEIIFHLGVPDTSSGSGRRFYTYNLADGRIVQFVINSSNRLGSAYIIDREGNASPIDWLSDAKPDNSLSMISDEDQSFYRELNFEPPGENFSPVFYSDLCGAKKETLSQMDESEFIAWIKKEYGYDNTLSRVEEENGIVTYEWTEKFSYGTLELHKGRIYSIVISRYQSPKFGQVMNGIGTPQTVDRSYGISSHVSYSFGLNYPEQGIYILILGQESLDKAKTPGRLWLPLTQNLSVAQVICYFDSRMPDSFKHKRIHWPGIDVLVPLIDAP